MRIALGSDHAGRAAKDELADRLRSWGHEVLDLGTDSDESVDYPDFAEKVGRAVTEGRAERGLLLCGTGIGQSIAANKIRGIRAALVHDAMTATMARRHNDANVLCLGTRVTTAETRIEALRIFLETAFEGGRHDRRLEKIARLEQRTGD